MRSTLRRFSFVLGFAITGLLVGAGCGSSSDASAKRENGSNVEDPTPPPIVPSYGVEDAAPQTKSAYRGNPLCRVAADTCMPDDDGKVKTSGVRTCPELAALETDASIPMKSIEGCRIGPKAPNGVEPACQSVTGKGVDGAVCETGADCAAGFDCVVGAGEKGKACRHYCCVGGCKAQLSQNGGPTFCDVQRLADIAVNAPVCVPLKRCKLLANDCTSTETCAIVTDSGDTSCVAVGDRQVGESCDDAHCGSGLTCLGQPGARTCHALCDTTKATSCGSNKRCVSSAIVKDSNVGICQDP